MCNPKESLLSVFEIDLDKKTEFLESAASTVSGMD